MRPSPARAAAILLLILAATTSIRPAAAQEAGPTIAWRNARWFDGTRFATGTRYTHAGRFVATPRTRPDSTVDLAGAWVVPPYGDAHTHSPDVVWGFEAIRDFYLREGIFYVQTLANHRSGRLALAGRVNVPSSLDVAFADMAVTGSGGHPQVLYESLALFRRPYVTTPAERVQAGRSTTQDGDVYLRFDQLSQLDSLAAILARDALPVLKLILVNSQDWARNGRDTLAAGEHGLDPALVAPLVRVAHRLGRKVWAHVESAADFRTALEAGVGAFAHVPGYGAGTTPDSLLGALQLPEALVREAGRRRVSMTATLGLGYAGVAADTAHARRYRAVAVANVRRLRAAGVRLLAGSDTYSSVDAVRADADAMATEVGFTNLDVLRYRSVETPRAIFPGRKVGGLGPGYEASFLGLACNPLEDRRCLTTIVRRVKQAQVVAVPEAAVAP